LEQWRREEVSHQIKKMPSFEGILLFDHMFIFLFIRVRGHRDFYRLPQRVRILYKHILGSAPVSYNHLNSSLSIPQILPHKGAPHDQGVGFLTPNRLETILPFFPSFLCLVKSCGYSMVKSIFAIARISWMRSDLAEGPRHLHFARWVTSRLEKFLLWVNKKVTKKSPQHIRHQSGLRSKGFLEYVLTLGAS
jgi:hypothetical protein